MEHVSGQQHLAGPAEGLEVGLRDVKDLAATAEQIDGEQDEVRHHARRTAVPDHDVAQQMNLQKKLGISDFILHHFRCRGPRVTQNSSAI